MTKRSRTRLSESLPFLINRVGSRLAADFADDVLAKRRISIPIWRVLIVLVDCGTLRQVDVAEHISIDPSTLSRLVTRMVRLGLVSRTRSARSGREVVLRSTAKGRAIVTSVLPLASRYETILIAGLSAEDLETMRRCLRHMYRNIEAAGLDRRPHAAASSGLPAAKSAA